MGTMPTTSPRVRAPEVMVSYSSQDRERVLQFVRALRGSGVAVWIDQGGIDGAQRWSEEIVNAIEACSTVLLFVSKSSMESKNIAKEVALAWEGGKHFLPLALEEAKIPKSLQYQLAGIQYVKLYEGDPDVKFESVLRALVRLGVRVSPYSMAVVSAGIGDREQALEWLTKACEERSSGLAQLKSEPRFQSMRNDSRFVELVNRAEALALELEEPTAEIVLPQPVSVPSVSVGPVPAWKRLLWPEMRDAKTARDAAAQAVWASLLIIVCRWIISFLVPTNMLSSTGWWDDPIVMTLIWGVIGFSVQKMSRPAALIGTALCILGAWFNLAMLTVFKAQMQAQEMTTRLGQTYYGPNYSGLYFASLFGVIAGIVCVIAFVNASRGTLAYRQMVTSRLTEDKQDALSSQNLLAVRRKTLAALQRLWELLPLPGARSEAIPQFSMARSATRSGAPEPVQDQTSASSEGSRAASAVDKQPESTPSPQPAPAIPTDIVSSVRVRAVDRLPSFDDAPEVHTLSDLIGAVPFRLTRLCSFFLANLVTGLLFVLARVVLVPTPVHPVYWQYALLKAVAITVAGLVGFLLFRRRGWLASIAAALMATTVMVVIAHFTLATFDISDVFYREQFQEFVLVPFADVLFTLLALYYAVQRIRPLAFGLFVGMLASEILTSLLVAILRDLGSGTPPDPVLSGTLVFFVGVRSLVFAVVMWAGLKVLRTEKPSATKSSARA